MMVRIAQQRPADLTRKNDKYGSSQNTNPAVEYRFADEINRNNDQRPKHGRYINRNCIYALLREIAGPQQLRCKCYQVRK